MNDIKFRDHEVVRIQGKEFVLLGGRLRVAHELHGGKISITTELVSYVLEDHAVVRATIETPAGTYTGTGTATKARDPRMVHCLIETGEARAVARALRLAGVAPECIGAEEIADEDEGIVRLDGSRGASESPAPRPAVPGTNGGAHRNGTPATTAQLRCIRALARQAGQEADELIAGVLPGATLEGLSLSAASRVIDQAQARARGGNGHAGNGR